MMQKELKNPETLAHDTYFIVLSKSCAMNTNMAEFRWFSKIFASVFLDKRCLSIGRVKHAVKSF